MKEDEKQSHGGVIILGGSANAPCPKCGRRIAFFSGKQGSFISETKSFASDATVVLHCPIDGDFNMRAGDFHDKLNQP